VLVVVDAENVRRSLWPNPSREELVARARRWAAQEGHELLIVFDGEAPEQAPDLRGSAYADDEIVRIAATLVVPYWLVTSDRGLRERVGERAERVVGGGTFARLL
jgi:rRNA-processing protein FCF1